MIDIVRAYFIEQLASVVNFCRTHFVVNEMVPADGTFRMFTGEPDNLDCFRKTIFPQQIDRMICQLDGILQPAYFAFKVRLRNLFKGMGWMVR